MKLAIIRIVFVYFIFFMKSSNDTAFFGHPKGLFFLFFTETWERFSYYGMRGILVLFIYSSVEEGGMGWTRFEALQIYGWYTMFVYLSSIPGGIIADRFLGQRKTVMLGGVLLVLGHSILAVPTQWAFFTGLVLIVLGVGGLKANISSMVGGLYKPKDQRRDKGFTIFYMGINLGALLASLTVGYVANIFGWHYGFGLAGIGMVIGLIVYASGQKYLEGVGELLEKQNDENENRNSEVSIWKRVFGDMSSVATAIISLGVGGYILSQDTSVNSLLWCFVIVALGLALSVGIIIHKDLEPIERDRVSVLLLSFIVIIVFWGAFEQAGGLMNIYANEKIDRVVPLIGEIPAAVFQGVNAFFIIVFGVPIANYWMRRRKNKKEDSSIFKMAVGTILMGLGFLCMAKASLEADGEAFGKGLLIWLILAYLLHTIGELCSSPVSLSFITKLAPLKYASIMMGIYWAATGLGNKLAGKIGETSQIESVSMMVQGTPNQLQGFIPSAALEEGKEIELKLNLYLDNGVLFAQNTQTNVATPFGTSEKRLSLVVEDGINSVISEFKDTSLEKPYHAFLRLSQSEEKSKDRAQLSYDAKLDVLEIQNKQELYTFLWITVFTSIFGIALLLLLKKLKRLTHGAE